VAEASFGMDFGAGEWRRSVRRRYECAVVAEADRAEAEGSAVVFS